MPKKIRVYELARELGLTNKEALDLCLALGIGVKSHSSSIEDAQADRVRRKADSEGLRRAVSPEEPAEQKPARATTTRRTSRRGQSSRLGRARSQRFDLDRHPDTDPGVARAHDTGDPHYAGSRRVDARSPTTRHEPSRQRDLGAAPRTTSLACSGASPRACSGGSPAVGTGSSRPPGGGRVHSRRRPGPRSTAVAARSGLASRAAGPSAHELIGATDPAAPRPSPRQRTTDPAAPGSTPRPGRTAPRWWTRSRPSSGHGWLAPRRRTPRPQWSRWRRRLRRSSRWRRRLRRSSRWGPAPARLARWPGRTRPASPAPPASPTSEPRGARADAAHHLHAVECPGAGLRGHRGARLHAARARPQAEPLGR